MFVEFRKQKQKDLLLSLLSRVMDHRAINALYRDQNEPYIALPAMFIGGDQWDFWVEFGDYEVIACVLLQQLARKMFEETLEESEGSSCLIPAANTSSHKTPAGWSQKNLTEDVSILTGAGTL